MTFCKYSGSGNDFLIFTLDEMAYAFLHSVGIKEGDLSPLAKTLCHRFRGIGADGLVAIKPVSGKSYAYEWDFYNADGSKAHMCGNASRCVGHYAYDMGLAGRKHKFLSLAGVIGIEIDEANKCGGVVQSDLGGFKILQNNISESNPYGVECWYLLDTGVPHLVGFVSHKEAVPTHKDKLLEVLRYRYNANINLAYVPPMAECKGLDSENRDLKRAIVYATYERGVEDITQACGTGAAAIFAMARELEICGDNALFLPPSNEILSLSMDKNTHILFKAAVQKIAQCIWCGALS